MHQINSNTYNLPTMYLKFFLNKFIVYHHLNCEISKSNFLYRAPLVTASVVRGVYIKTNLFDRWTCTNDDLQFVVILQRSHSVIFLKIAVLKNSGLTRTLWCFLWIFGKVSEQLFSGKRMKGCFRISTVSHAGRKAYVKVHISQYF